MKIDMHCHVREGSIDSKVPIEEFIKKLHSTCDYKCGKLDHAGSLRSSRTDFRNPCDDLV